MSQEFDTTGRSPELNDFESQLRRFQPLPAENVEEIFYRAGWTAAELARKDRQSITGRTWNCFTNSFTRGLVVGMAAALLVAVCLPGSWRFWSGRDAIVQSPESNAADEENAISAELPTAVDITQQNVAVSDAVNGAQTEPLSLAFKSETISQLFPWNWKSVDRPPAKQFPRANEASLLSNAFLSQAFTRPSFGPWQTGSAPPTNASASEEVPALAREPQLRVSPLDIQRVLDFY